MYERLAAAMLALSPAPVPGSRVLDLGAGTGVVGRAALAAGARSVLAVDLSSAMLRAARPARDGRRAAPIVADCVALPVRSRSMDLVLAGCCLGHLPDPAAGLREARRAGRALVATAFPAGWTHPAKAAVDESLAAHGYEAPAWHRRLKLETEPLVDDPGALLALAVDAGWTGVDVAVREVVTGLRSPAELAAWRLGMAHVAPWLAGLDPPRRDAVVRDAREAVRGAPELVVPLMVLTAT